MLKVHHLNNSRSQRILWMLEELGLDYELVKHWRNAQTQRAPESLFKVHPLGKGPTVEVDGTVLAESGAIIDYVTRRLAGGKLSVPESSAEYADYLFWLHYAEGSAMGPVLFDLLDGMTGSQAGDALRGFYLAEIEHSHTFMDNALAGQDTFIRSGFTAADIHITWVLELSAERGHVQKKPRLAAYLRRMQQRPAYVRAMQKGGEQNLSVFLPK